ncbi:type IV secretion system protein VirB2 [Luteibacter sp. UNCMF331Sha3.1]|uniref:TrbC/VirB2 family protein n=1 Tax=Luteibacter sp. UNCMF331Sha3.1 TaxID=1502760 RepID=UPI0008B9EFD6|nr:TrbC/VirB2 family protein [Luteibacter sp. UNCMF331Sha3.1]SEM96281.1 type IV secretion system protein VirB2 [Luteibacter sp. UNCMF331Sha3.1]
MTTPYVLSLIARSGRPVRQTIGVAALFTALMIPGLAVAQVGEAGTKVCGFFENINSLLNAASIVVVTISVIFSGYQIAFAHKRIAEVAPPLIGGVLIGAAAQVAKMVVGGNGNGGGASACTSSSGGFMMDAINTAMHLLAFHV